MYNFYIHSTPNKSLVDADTGRVVGTFDRDGFLSADAIATACADPLISRVKATYPPHYAVCFTVWDGLASPIADATIRVGGKEMVTDSNGCAEVKLCAGSYAVTVEKDGFSSETDEIILEGNPIHATYRLSESEA